MNLRVALKVCFVLAVGAAGLRSEPGLRTSFIRADFNGDHEPDTLIGAPGPWASRYEGVLALSDGRRQQFAFGIHGNWLVTLRAQDVDSDGDKDIVVTRLGSVVLVLVNDGRGGFDSAVASDYPGLNSPWTGISLTEEAGQFTSSQETDSAQPGVLTTHLGDTLLRCSQLRSDVKAHRRAGWSVGRSSRSPPHRRTAA